MSHFHLRPFFTFATLLVLVGCDPAFETSADLCAAGQNSEVIVSLADTNPYSVTAVREDSTYLLYLQDIFEAAEPDASATLTADQLGALDEIIRKVNDASEFNMQYQQSAGVVTASANPLDFLEELISTDDPNRVIGVFQDAKNQIAAGIKSDDSFCIYDNGNIRFVDSASDDVLFANFSLSYNPFSRIVQQTLLISEVKDDLSSAASRQTAPYIGFYQAEAGEFKSKGFTTPILRQAILNNQDSTESLIIDDGNDNDLGQLELSTFNAFCRDTDDEVTACPTGTNTRTPAKPQCDGTATDSIDETGENEERFIDLNGAFSGYKRIRLETDYVNAQVRVYVSDYNEAILDSDDTTIIKDPTDCEKQAVLDELAEANPGEGVRLTVVEDPNYDVRFQLDADGNREQDADGNDIVIEPVPAFSFLGTVIPSRQP